MHEPADASRPTLYALREDRTASRSDLELEARALETVNAVANELYEDLDLATLGERALNVLMDYTNVPAAALYTLSDDNAALEVLAQRGLGDHVLECHRSLSVGNGLIARAVAREAIVESHDLARDDRLNQAEAEGLLQSGFFGAVSVPLQCSIGVVGAMSFLLREHRPLTVLEAQTLLAVGRTIALAILNARHLARVEATEQALRLSHEKLEERVEERTRELREANMRLEKEVRARAELESALRTNEARYKRLSITDELTALYNARHFHKTLLAEVERASRYGDPLSLLLMDVDDFKQLNDRHGHPAGDRVLQRLGEIMRSSLRKMDLAFRYGGEEFAVILPRCGAEGARKLAEIIRTEFAASDFPLEGGDCVRTTLSAGVACYRRGESPQELLRQADDSMYAAKRAGKDRVRMLRHPYPEDDS